MSYDITHIELFDGMTYLGQDFIVGTLLPGFEEYGEIEKIIATYSSRNEVEIVLFTKKYCDSKTNKDSNWHIITPMFLETHPLNEGNLVYFFCVQCGTRITRKKNSLPLWLPYVTYGTPLSISPILRLSHTGETIDGKYGFATHDEAFHAGMNTLDAHRQSIREDTNDIGPWRAILCRPIREEEGEIVLASKSTDHPHITKFTEVTSDLDEAIAWRMHLLYKKPVDRIPNIYVNSDFDLFDLDNLRDVF